VQQKGHPIVVNMRQVLVVDENVEQEKTITKLAIGKPGGADFSGEKWELWTKVHCYACNCDIYPKLYPNLNDIVTSIINTASANDQAAIVGWEEEILPCEHTLTLQPAENVKIPPKYNATCNECSLSSNLWLCLTCGNLGCGRKYWDGSGGNNHGIDHFDKTHHPLAVKTGTITPDGNASVYCYACNNDVKDENLREHMIHFGINIDEQIKTEKTMTELSLDYNLNLTLSKQIEDGKVLPPIYGPGFTGLENLGNSCYMNSVLQILFSLETFLSQYLDTALIHLNSCPNEPPECFYCQVSKVIYGMHSGYYSSKKTKQLIGTQEIEEYQTGIRPASFKHLFGKDHAEFSSHRQQDAFEYLSYILDKFEKTEKQNGRPNPIEAFEFDLETRLQCVECACAKYKRQRTWYLPLGIPNWESKQNEGDQCSYEESIQKFLSEEKVELDCPTCHKKTQFTKTQRMLNYPRYLIVIFERFVYDWVPKKLETLFKFPIEGLDISILNREHSNAGEKVIEEDVLAEQEEEPQINQNQINSLIQEGVPELAAKHALLNTNHQLDMALMWFYENMENPVITKPVPKVKKGGVQQPKCNEEDVQTLISFGFTREQAEGSLIQHNGNTELAANYLFTNPGATFVQLSTGSKTGGLLNNDGKSVYNLYGKIFYNFRFYYSFGEEYYSWALCLSH
jgi:ubiquitin carboxyl-terminal hydrolase 5/13